MSIFKLFIMLINFSYANVWLGVVIDNYENKEFPYKGVYIKKINQKTPASKSSLKNGDIILKIDDKIIEKGSDMTTYISQKKDKDIIKVHYFDIQLKTMKEEKITLEKRPDLVTLSKNNFLNEKFTLKEIKDLDGKIIKFNGKKTIVEFWATWCPSCVAGIKKINPFLKNNKNIEYILISEEKADVIIKFLKKNNVGKARFVRYENLTNDYFVPVIPYFLLLDENGVVLKAEAGVEDLDKFLNNLR